MMSLLLVNFRYSNYNTVFLKVKAGGLLFQERDVMRNPRCKEVTEERERTR